MTDEIVPVSTGPQGAASIVMYRVGGRQYPLKTVAQCKVCSSPNRLTIEQEVANARSYVAIIKSLPEGHDLNPRNIRDHYANGHMPLEVETMRSIIDERARIKGVSIETGTAALVDEAAFAQVVLQKTYERMAKGEIEPTIRDGLRAGVLLHNIGLAAEGGDQADLVQAFVVYMETAQSLMPPQMWDEFGKRLGENPVLRALKERARQAQQAQAIEMEQG